MTPKTWLELEHTTHRYFLLSAAVRQLSLGIEHGVALLTAWPSASGQWVPPPFLRSLRHGWVGWGAKIFFQTFASFEGSSLSLPAALEPPHCNLLVQGRMARQGGDSFTASGPGSTIPRFFSSFLQWGSILLLGRDLAS